MKTKLEILVLRETKSDPPCGIVLRLVSNGLSARLELEDDESIASLREGLVRALGVIEVIRMGRELDENGELRDPQGSDEEEAA